MYLEIISGPYGYGICLEDYSIAGASGGGGLCTLSIGLKSEKIYLKKR